MLGSIDPQLGADQMLKMAIAMLILEALLGKEGAKDAGGALLMAALGSGSGASASMSSQSSSMSVEYSSMSSSASHSSEQGDAERGGRLDAQA